MQVFTCEPFVNSAERFKFEHKKKWADVCAMQSIDFLKNDERNSPGAQGLIWPRAADSLTAANHLIQ